MTTILRIAAFVGLAWAGVVWAQESQLDALLANTSSAEQAEVAAREEFRSLDEEVQDLKKEVLDLNRDLFLLEEELLFPANSQDRKSVV